MRTNTSNLRTIASFGFLIYLMCVLAWWYVYRHVELPKGYSLATSLFLWTIQFAPMYTIVVFFTGAALRHLAPKP